MSHNVDIKGTKINDLKALENACAELRKRKLNVTLDTESKTFRTYEGQSTNCDAVIRLGDEHHDIGLRKQADGTYTPVYDPYAVSDKMACAVLPKGATRYDPRYRISQLLQEYSTQVALRKARQMGHSLVSRTTDKKTGAVQLVFEAA